MPLVEIRNLTKSFRKGDEVITPLDAVDLDVEAGDFLSMMGPSGTGKSTLLNLVSGIDRPNTGSITVDGVEIRTLDIEGLLKTKTDYRDKDRIDREVLTRIREQL